MNNMQKAFKAKSGLRCMADGGIFKSMQRIGQDDVAVFTDAKNRVAGSEAYTPRAMRELPNQGITSGGVTTPLPAGVAPVPANMIGPPSPMPAEMPAAARISPALPPPAANLSVKPPAASPLPAPAAAPAQQFRPQDPYEKAAGKAPVAVTPRKIPMDYMAQTGGFGPTVAPPQPGAIGANRAEIGANRRPIGGIGAMGMPLMTSVGYASGGEVKGPGGPTDDEVGPVMLSDGEYVLPADTVRKVGKENLDALKDATHTPVGVKQRRGLRKMADGTKTEREKRLGALGLPITTSVGETNPIPRVGAMGLPITTSVGPEPMPRERTGALGLPITTSAGYGKPSAQPAPVSAEGWQGKPRATPQAPVAPAAEPGLLERLGSVPLPRDPRLLTADTPSTAPAAPTPATTTRTKTPGEVQRENFNATGGAGVGVPVAPASDLNAPFTPRGLTSAQSLELERQGVGLGAQMDPVMSLTRSDVPVQPAVPLSAQTDFNPSLTAGPRAFRSDTIREGVTPGEQVNLGNGIFATTDPTNGDKRLNSFTGVGSDFSADSARLGPDPNGADRARQDAIVEANLQAKPREVSAPQLRSNERGINSQFDKLAEAARKNFASPRAAGNLNKALERIEAQRMSALAQDADNMTRQQQIQSSSAATDRELASREAQAARVDETDRLTIDAQNTRAAEASAATSAFRATKLENDQFAIETRGMKYPPSKEDWLAGRRSGGKGTYINEKEVKANSQRVTARVEKLFPEDLEAQNRVIANARLFFGTPDEAVARYAPAVNEISQLLGRMDIGVPQKNPDGTDTWKATTKEMQKSADNLGTDIASIWRGDGPAYKLVDDSGAEVFVSKNMLSEDAQRFLQAYLQTPQKERD